MTALVQTSWRFNAGAVTRSTMEHALPGRGSQGRRRAPRKQLETVALAQNFVGPSVWRCCWSAAGRVFDASGAKAMAPPPRWPGAQLDALEAEALSAQRQLSPGPAAHAEQPFLRHARAWARRTRLRWLTLRNLGSSATPDPLGIRTDFTGVIKASQRCSHSDVIGWRKRHQRFQAFLTQRGAEVG